MDLENYVIGLEKTMEKTSPMRTKLLRLFFVLSVSCGIGVVSCAVRNVADGNQASPTAPLMENTGTAMSTQTLVYTATPKNTATIRPSSTPKLSQYQDTLKNLQQQPLPAGFKIIWTDADVNRWVENGDIWLNILTDISIGKRVDFSTLPDGVYYIVVSPRKYIGQNIEFGDKTIKIDLSKLTEEAERNNMVIFVDGNDTSIITNDGNRQTISLIGAKITDSSGNVIQSHCREQIFDIGVGEIAFFIIKGDNAKDLLSYPASYRRLIFEEFQFLRGHFQYNSDSTMQSYLDYLANGEKFVCYAYSE